ncbi:MAG: M15 family metallopeptidase [Fidelibacterota bacterium]
MKIKRSFRNTACLYALAALVFLFSCGEPPINRMDARKFSYVHEAVPDAKYDIRYITENNFLGTPVDGYLDTVAILSNEAMAALVKAAADLREKGCGIIVFDGYRPQKAVDHFVRWAKDPGDTLTKHIYYPGLEKDMLMKDDKYISSRSGHTRGSTVDLTLYDLETGELLDMGSYFDFFGSISNHGTDLISAEQTANRNILRDAMVANGFRIYSAEWWHYTLDDEPYPDRYFNFDVNSERNNNK